MSRDVTAAERRFWQAVMTQPMTINCVTWRRAVTQEAFPRQLDLHGLTIQQAWQTTMQFVQDARHHGVRTVLIITGKSGPICREFPNWMAANPVVTSSRPVNGGGAYIVSLRQ